MQCIDCENRQLDVGDRVVYNQSGMLHVGVITRITKSNNYVARNNPMQPHIQFIVRIGHSVVRNKLGVYLLERAET